MSRTAVLTAVILLTAGTLFAQRPDWVDRLPFREDAFMGVGEGSTDEQAEALAKRDILIQLSSRVEAALTIEETSGEGRQEVVEKLDAYFGSNTLRAAEREDSYQEGGRYWVLLRYNVSCGEMLVNSALSRYEEQFGYDRERILDQLFDESITEALRVERRLQELDLEDYRSEDINVILRGTRLIIRVMNFLPSEISLTASQQAGLVLLSDTLFEELAQLSYESLAVVGHANPTGAPDEQQELVMLSRNRADTMTAYLRNAGVTVDEVDWRAGDETIGDLTTDEGKGKNRRVEIVVSFE